MSEPRKQSWNQISLAGIIMLLTGILVGTVVSSIREEAEATKQYEQRIRAAKLREEQLRAERLNAGFENYERNHADDRFVGMTRDITPLNM